MVSSPEKESRQSPTVSTQNLHKSRNSTIRREDQQLYDNAIGKIDHQLLQVSAGCFLPATSTNSYAHTFYDSFINLERKIFF